MTMTIEELAEKLEAEIAARKLLERRLNTQNSSVSNVENRLNGKINVVSSKIDAYVKSTESLTQAESNARSNGDEVLSSNIETNTRAIQQETEARIAADDALQEQIRKNVSSMAILGDRINACDSSISDNASEINKEKQVRAEKDTELDSDIKLAKSELEQKISACESRQGNHAAKILEISDQLNVETEKRKATDRNVQANTESIISTNHDLDLIKAEMDNINNKFIDEIRIENMIRNNISGKLENQTKNITKVLRNEEEARKVDIANMKQYAEAAQNGILRAQDIVDEYQKRIQNSMKRMRDAFNMLLPIGTILPYAGDLNLIPDGWRICNGANGTPDLVGKVLVGARAVTSSSDDFVLDEEGGEKEVTLTEENMPPHYHYVGTIDGNKASVFISGYNSLGKTASYKSIEKHKNLWGTKELTGKDTPSYVCYKTNIPDDTQFNMITSGQTLEGKSKGLNNMPPYRCVYYIMKMF